MSTQPFWADETQEVAESSAGILGLVLATILGLAMWAGAIRWVWSYVGPAISAWWAS